MSILHCHLRQEMQLYYIAVCEKNKTENLSSYGWRYWKERRVISIVFSKCQVSYRMCVKGNRNAGETVYNIAHH
jgi:hypothetical protein